MSKTADDGELVYGSGNVFRDFGRADSHRSVTIESTEAAEMIAASQSPIIGILDKRSSNDLATRQAATRGGIHGPL